MIDPKELRIGNYVLHNGRYRKIVGLYLGTDVNAEPIPLSEELLLRCGFEKSEERYYNCYYKSCFYILYAELIYRICEAGCLLDMNIAIEDFREIQYLHQLQNIYFALTGEELEVNLS